MDASTCPIRKNEAVQALIDLSHKYKGELTVVALGPMTNVALAILLDPHFVSNVKQFVVMGALSRGDGNFTPHCEFNVGCDPEATEILYQHCTADKLIVVPFETAVDHIIPWPVFEDVFNNSKTLAGSYLYRIWKFTKSFAPETGFLPCDAYAVAILLHPSYVTSSRVVKGHIHLTYDDHRGANVWKEDQEHANVTLVTHIDKDIFVKLLRQCADGERL